MERFNKIIFKLDKRNNVRYTRIFVQEVEDGAIKVYQSGQLGGTESETVTPIYPKNVGRANETTPIQQAILEARSHYNKLLDKGYKDLGPEEEALRYPMQDLIEFLINVKGTDANGWLKPMLAQPTKHLSKRAEFPGYTQRKYDGIRATVKAKDGARFIVSRNGKLFSYIDHILEDLPELPEGWEWDGELFSEEFSLQQIVSRTKSDHPDNKLIGYRIYDIAIPGMPFKDRWRKVLIYTRKAGPSITRAHTYRVDSLEELWEYFHKFKKEGYEGAMYRNPDGLYEYGERSFGLIKAKDVMEKEFEIVGVEEATGKDQGTPIFILELPDGDTFRSRPMGSWDERHIMYLDREELIGKQATVLFQQYTDSGKPFHGRVKVIRDYE